MNSVILRGFVANKPFVSGKAAMFTLAVQDRTMPKDADGNYHTDFIKVVSFAQTATLVSKYVEVGTELLISGKLSSGSYDKTNESGEVTKVYTTEVTCQNLEFVSRSKRSDSSEDTGTSKSKKTA